MNKESGSSGLTLPSKNIELKRQEDETLNGEDLLIRLKLPNQDIIEMKMKESKEVGFVKLLLAKKVGVDAGKIRLVFNGKDLLNPMSLCDHQGIKPPHIDVDVFYV